MNRLGKRKGDSDDPDFSLGDEESASQTSESSTLKRRKEEDGGVGEASSSSPSKAKSVYASSSIVKTAPASAATMSASSAPKMHVNDMMSRHFPEYYSHFSVKDLKVKVDEVKTDTGLKLYPHVMAPNQSTRDFEFWSPRIRVGFPMVYPVGNHIQGQKELKASQDLTMMGNSPNNTYYVFSMLSAPSWDAQRRTEQGQDQDALDFMNWCTDLNRDVSRQLLRTAASYEWRLQAELKVGKDVEQEAQFMRKQNRDADAEALLDKVVREGIPVAEMEKVAMTELLRPVVVKRKETKKQVSERLKEKPTSSKQPCEFPNTEQIRVRSRTFRTLIYNDQKERAKKQTSWHPIISDALNTGFELNDVPMYDAKTLHIRDGSGLPIPIPARERRLNHNDLVAFKLRCVPCDFSEKRKGAGIALQLLAIVFFKSGAHALEAAPPLRNVPVFSFDDEDTGGFDAKEIDAHQKQEAEAVNTHEVSEDHAVYDVE
jgi:hypothetical protein